MNLKCFLIAALLIVFTRVQSQITIKDVTRDETVLYAQTKQVNQFFRRFNGEENRKGDRLYPRDKKFRDVKERKKFIEILFDEENTSIDRYQKNNFIEDATDEFNPSFLDFHAGKWFAEVTAKFRFHGKVEDVILFLKIEKENLGYKWVFSNIYFDKFNEMFYMDTTNSESLLFLHPMSHELDFMNLQKVFKNKKYIEYFAAKDHPVDFLSIFFYEIKKSNLTFESINNVKFHIFQAENWYFEISYFNRSGENSGWLISNLIKAPENKKEELIKLINHEK